MMEISRKPLCGLLSLVVLTTVAFVQVACTSHGTSAQNTKPSTETAKTKPSIETGKPEASAKPASADTVKPAAPAEPAKPTGSAVSSTAASAPTADRLVLGTPKGIVALSVDGSTQVLSPKAVTACMVDTRLDTVWAVTESSGGTQDVQGLTLTGPTQRVTAAQGLPLGIMGAVGVSHGSYGVLGKQSSHHFDVMAVLELQPNVRWTSVVGCSGMLEEQCYVDDDANVLSPEIKARIAAIGKVAVGDSAKLTAMSSAAGQRALASTRKLNCRRAANKADRRCATITVPGVNTKECLLPKECGKAKRVAGTPLYVATVHNERNDVFHESQQFYDPARKVYLHPQDLTKTSATPHGQGGDLVSLEHSFVSSQGLWYEPTTGKLWSLKTQSVVAQGPKGAIPCGFSGGWQVIEPGL